MNNKGQFSIIAALLVAVILIVTVVSTYSAVRYNIIGNQPQVLTAVDETNLAVKQLLGFTVGYYGSILNVTSDASYANSTATKYLLDGLGNITYAKPELGLSFNVTSINLYQTWYMASSYSFGQLNVTYDLTGIGLYGLSYSPQCRLDVQVLPSTLDGHAYVNVMQDGDQPLNTLTGQNFNFYNYSNMTWRLVPSTNATAFTNGTYKLDIPANPSAYQIQVTDARGISVVASSFSQYNSTLNLNGTAIRGALAQNSATVEVLQNGTMRWLGQSLNLTTQTIPIPRIPVKSIHVNQTFTNRTNQEVPFQVEDWASNYGVPLGLTNNYTIFDTLFDVKQMIVYQITDTVSQTTIWWNGSDLATQTPNAYTNRYFLNDNPPNPGQKVGFLSNGIQNLTIQIMPMDSVYNENVFNVTAQTASGTSSSVTTFMRIDRENSTYGADAAYVIHHGVVRDIVLQESEWNDGAGVNIPADCPNIYAYVVLTLPARASYFTYQTTLTLLDSAKSRTITDLCPIQLYSSPSSLLIQTENGVLGTFPVVANGTGTFKNNTVGSWTPHHWSQIINNNTGVGAGIMFTDTSNQQLYAFDSIAPNGAKGGLNVSTTSKTVEFSPVTSLGQVGPGFNQANTYTWYGAVATFDSVNTSIYSNITGTPTGLWSLVEQPPAAIISTNAPTSARITLMPSNAPNGVTVAVSGSGFTPNSAIIITYDQRIVATTTADSSGFILSGATFTLPMSPGGPHTVTATDSTSNSASSTFTVAPIISLNPTTGNVGSVVAVSGSGFASSSTISIKYGGATQSTQPTTITSDVTGSFSASFTAPASTAGNHAVTATDGANSYTAQFTITASITVNPTSGNPGTIITISGSGFAANSILTAKFGGSNIVLSGTTSTSATGSFSGATFIMPATTAGPQTVVVSDSANPANSAQATVTETVPFGIDGTAYTSTNGNGFSVILTTIYPNDLIILQFAERGSGTITNIHDNAGILPFSAWTERTSGPIRTSDNNQEVDEWYAIANSALSSDTITVTVSGSSQNIVGIAFGIYGANTAQPFDTHAGLPYSSKGTSGNPTVNGVSTSNANDIILGLVGYSGTSSVTETAGAGFSLITSQTVGSGSSKLWGAAEYETLMSTLSGASVSWGTNPSSSDWAMIVDAVQQAPTSVTFAAPSGMTNDAQGTVLSVDGLSYTYAQLPHTFSWVPGYVHNVTASSPVAAGAGKQYVFASWSNGLGLSGASGNYTVPSSSQTITANYQVQYQVSFNASPSANGTITPSGSNVWENSGSLPIQATPNSGYGFASWTATGSISFGNSTSDTTTATINGPGTITANFAAIENITFSAPSGMNGDASGTVLAIDGTLYMYAQLPQTFSWNSGSNHAVAASTPISAGSTKQYIWSSWTNGNSLSIASGTYTVPSSNQTVTANYQTQYQIAVVSAHGSPNPVIGTNWITAGSTTASITSPVVDNGVNYTCTGWTGTGDVSASGTGTTTTFTISQASSITWNWQPTLLAVTFTTAGMSSDTGSATVLTIDSTPYNNSQLQGPLTFNWTSGSTHTVTASTPVSGGTNKQYVFTTWTNGNGLLGATGTFTVPASITTVTTNYKTQWQATFQQSGLSNDASGTVLTVGANTYTYNQLPQTNIWVDDGTAFSSTATVTSSVTGKQYVLTSVTGGLATPIHSSGTATANYQTQYLLTMAANFGTTSPAVGTSWINAGSSVTIYAAITNGTNERYIWAGWAGTGTGSYSGIGNNSALVTLNAAITETASWTHQYQVTFAVNPSGSGTTTPSTATWYNAGVGGQAISATKNNGYTFSSWSASPSGSVTFVSSGSASTTTTVNAPSTVTATFTANTPVTITLSPTSNSGSWSNPTRAYADDTNYATSNANNNAHTFSGYGFTIPSGATITLVRVRVDAYVSNNDLLRLAVSSNGGTTFTTAGTDISPGTSQSTTWKDVTSLTSWTVAKINNNQIQARITQIQNGGGADTVYLDWIPIEVTYIPP